MPLTGPFLVDTNNFSKWASGTTNYPGPFKRTADNARYMIWQANATVGVFKSVNGGLTWNQLPVAGPVAPTFLTALCCRRIGVTDEIRMVWRQHTAGAYAFVIASFNMATEVLTWPIASFVATFQDDLGGYEWKASTGGDWVYYLKFINANQREATLARWNGAAWLADITYSHLGPNHDTRIQGGAVNDENDTSHVTYLQLPVPGFAPVEVYYRQISATGVMTAPILVYQHVAGGGSTFLFGLANQFDATTLIFPYKKKAPGLFGIYTAAFLSCSDYHAPAPVFTNHDIPGSQRISETTSAKINGAQQIWWIENVDLLGNDLDRTLSIDWDGAVFSNYTVQHDELANPSFPPVFQFMHDLAIPVDLGAGVFGIHIALEYPAPPEGFILCTGFFWIGGAAPLPPTITVNKVTFPAADPGRWNLQIDGVTVGTGANVGNGGTTGAVVVAVGGHQIGETPMPGTIPADFITGFSGDCLPDGSIVVIAGDNKVAVITNSRIPPAGPLVSGGTRRMVVLVPNYWDHCLRAAPPDWKDLPPPIQCCVPDEQSYFKWVTPPQGYRPFRQVGSVPTPLAAAGDVVVLQFMVPFGYDGVIRGMFHKYTGPGFLEGNGDLIWRLRTNNIYAKHLGAMQVTVGDVDKPHPVSDGIPLTSRQWIRYIVNAPNLSGGILPVNSSIVCGVEGWFFPRR